MNVELTPAGLVHCPVLAAMHGLCFVEQWSAGSMAGALSMPGSAGLIAAGAGALEPGGEAPAGFVLWRVAADEAEILTIAVLPHRRRAGIGARLLDGALDSARRDGARAMFLEAASGNRAALALYEAKGFVAVGVRKGYYNGEDAVTMRRHL